MKQSRSVLFDCGQQPPGPPERAAFARAGVERPSAAQTSLNCGPQSPGSADFARAGSSRPQVPMNKRS
jgi:hypothetical protein